ncbi:MAG: HAMP domain-containing histidine kinase [Burkholderiales bacterium]|nr:HAMP domain-containing histidine kinase [Burkholderiales bacterium]
MRFRLVRYFTLASVGIFAGVAAAMAYFANEQATFVEGIQRQEIDFVKKVQAGFAKQQEAEALKDLVATHEAGNVTLTRLFANTLWEKDFAPFVAKVAAMPIDGCRAMEDVVAPDGKKSAPKEKKACFAEVGAQIRALPEFKALDAKVFDMMKKTNVLKIKVFDLRGITAYSSEHAQVGEDKSTNGGWQGALQGTPKSELSYRDKFSAFEGVIEKRDLISSYLPVYGAGDAIVGVFEVYSDMTPLLAKTKATSAKIAATAKSNEATMERVSAENLDVVGSMSLKGLMIVGGLLLLLFSALYVIVRRAESIIVQQDKDREHDQQQMAQNEKMASLGQMVAGVAHQLNTPLAFSRSNISMVMDALKEFEAPLKVAHAFARAANASSENVISINIASSRKHLASMEDGGGDVPMLTQMLSDTLQGIDQMHELVENLRDFTRLDRAKIAQFDINKGLRTVTYIARSAIPNRVEVVEDYGDLPLVECNPSQLNQVFLNLINNAAQAIPGEGKVTVRSRLEDGLVRVDIADTGSGIPPEVQPHIFETYYTTKPVGEGTGLGLPIVKSIVTEHGGDVTFRTQPGVGTVFSVFLPVAQEAVLKKAA